MLLEFSSFTNESSLAPYLIVQLIRIITKISSSYVHEDKCSQFSSGFIEI